MAETTDTPLDIAEQIFKSLVWDNLVAAGLAALFVAVPVLAIWPIQPIVSYTVGLFSDQLFAMLELAVDVEAIALVNDAHRAAYDAASLQLSVIAHDKGIDSNDFIQARDAAAKALASFTQFGSRLVRDRSGR